MKHSHTITKRVETFLPTEFGDFTIYGYVSSDAKEHVALIKNISHTTAIPCRIHSECLTGEVFGSLRCDCKEQLEKSFDIISHAPSGILIYLRQEGRGIGLIEKLKAYNLQNKGKDTVDANLELGHEADLRDYGIAAQILKDLHITKVKLITNNPNKITQIQTHGIKVVERIPIIPEKINKYNSAYIHTKLNRMKHMLNP